ncbi:OLC1v1003943C1 [Oldenlandia corymbosa var. corymbosa]|uniref:OLC1v1003943C1 n=1 Tax=Oldenlandia corymbosa var. corymbosa TaxID=529605 RepID=A0AAV1DE48_OLDCO|nr:OLC1v1003943C1 [Oldenlandia corymbosa var. corymbosa]
MAALTSSLLFVILALSTIARAQDRAPHGLEYESPMALSPEAYDFFNPDAQPESSTEPCSTSDCTTLPEAATVQSTPAHESTSPPEEPKKPLRTRSIATVPIGLVFALILGMFIYYVVYTRQTNAARTKAAQQFQTTV